MSKKILGLDIRENAIAAVLIGGTLQGNQIEAYEYIRFPESTDPETEPCPEKENATQDAGERLSYMLSVLSESIDFQGAICVASVPSDHVSFRNITVPFENEKKIRQIIHFELEPVMPGAVDDLQVDFRILDIRNEEGLTPLVTASVKKGLLDSFEFCLKEKGYDPQAVVPGCCAAAWHSGLLCEKYSDYLFADIHDSVCTLFLLADRKPCFIRPFRIQPEKADLIAAEIRRTVLSFCESWQEDYEPEALVVSGDYFKDGIPDAFSENSGILTELSDFSADCGFHMENRLKAAWNSPVFDGAFALAYNVMFGVRSLRFTERFFAFGKYVEEHRKQLVNTGILLLLVIIAGLASGIFESWKINSRINAVRKEMVAVYRSAFPDATVVKDPYSQMIGKVKTARENSTFQEKNAGNIRVIDMLNEMSKAIPKDLSVEIDRFVFGTGDLKISGKTDSYGTVDSMKTELEKVPFFAKVVISSTTNDKADNSVKFKLKIEFDNKEAKG